MTHFGVPTPWRKAEGHTGGAAIARRRRTPRGQRPRARTEAPRTGTGRSRVRLRRGGRRRPHREVQGHTPMMDERGKSDRPVVPEKPPNKAEGPARGGGGGKGAGQGELAPSATRSGHRAGSGAPSALERVRQAAERDRKQRFTALLHHVYDVERLRAAYLALKRDAAPGIDGETWQHYGAGPGGAISRTCRTAAARGVPGEAGAAGVHPEGGRAAAAARAFPRWKTRSSSAPSSRC